MNVVVSGANRGIGLALVQQYIAQGATVYAICRNSSDELNKTGARIIDKIDMANPDTIQSLNQLLNGVVIDLLINNAGVLGNESVGDWDPNTIDYQFRVNAMAPLLVTQVLQSQLVEGSKVVLVTSRMGSMEDNSSGGYYGYRMSKAALNAAGVSLARDLNDRGISVLLLHPGFVQTDMVNGNGDISAQQAAQNMRSRIAALSLDCSGAFWHANGDDLPW